MALGTRRSSEAFRDMTDFTFPPQRQRPSSAEFIDLWRAAAVHPMPDIQPNVPCPAGSGGDTADQLRTGDCNRQPRSRGLLGRSIANGRLPVRHPPRPFGTRTSPGGKTRTLHPSRLKTIQNRTLNNPGLHSLREKTQCCV